MEIYRTPAIVAGKPRGYAKGTKVTGSRGFVFLAGCVGMDVNTGEVPKGAGEQARIAMENIKTRLEEYGSSLKNIMHIWQFVKGEFPNGVFNDPRYAEIRNAVEDFWRENCPEFLRENNPPPFTLIGATSLALPELDIEIVATAAVP